jgi:Tfp pilus assembly protein PilO
MLKNFDLAALFAAGTGQFKLRITGVVLALLNGIALYFYLDPPGGTRAELTQQEAEIRSQIQSVMSQAKRVRQMASRVQTGSDQCATFEQQYFLNQRVAYGTVLEEIQRMAGISGLQERDAVYSEEPIEGTADLSLLNITANYEGSYPSLIRFLYETDRSPMLLMLDALTASPEQKNGQISVAIRYQVVIREPLPAAGTMQPISAPGGQR